jgi:hypothetical protein
MGLPLVGKGSCTDDADTSRFAYAFMNRMEAEFMQ